MPVPVLVELDLRLDLKAYGRAVTTYRISEAAQRAGFTASALRFYEASGLVPEAARTPGGYRTYDEAAVERLRFVHRARGLGLPLEEIRGLVQIWDAGPCAPVQHSLAVHIAARRGQVQDRVGELQALAAQLRDAELAVLAAPGGGGCGPGCACLAGPDLPSLAQAADGLRRPAGTVELTLLPTGPVQESPISAAATQPLLACTLGVGELPERLRAWRDLAGEAFSREAIFGGERLGFAASAGLTARVGGLCEREQECCLFFTFVIVLTRGGVTLDVTAPDGEGQLVTALLDGRS